MAVQEALKYLPKNREAAHVFDKINKNFPRVSSIEDFSKLPLFQVQKMAGDYVTTSVAYFANYPNDNHLEEIGTTAWHTINQRRAVTAYCEDPIFGAAWLGLPLMYALTLKSDEPNTFVLGRRQGAEIAETSITVIPPHLLLRAQQRPIEALATMVFILSQIRDFANGRTHIDQELMMPRGFATEAQFLSQALNEQPQLQLPQFYKDIIARYPHGITDLPVKARYKGKTGAEAKKSNLN